MYDDYLEAVREIQRSRNYDELWDLLSEIEDEVGYDEMWFTVREYFSTDELVDVLEYICKEKDI